MNSLTRSAPVALDAVAYQMIRDLSSALADPQAAQREFVYQTSLALCSHLMSHYEHQAPPTERPKVVERIALSSWQERMAKDIMTHQMSQGLSIARVASECSLSRSHFSRAFKKNTGVSPRDWFLQARIDRAKTLLVEGALSISQTSLECGFADQSHFTRVFTRMAGITPLNWRRSHAC